MGRDRGASTVEFALLLPVFVALVVATVTFGATLWTATQVTSAVRETARFGATLPFAAAPGSTGPADVNAWLDRVGAAAAANAGIDLTQDPDTFFVCVGFGNPGSGLTSQFRTWGTADSRTGGCVVTARPGLRVDVVIRVLSPVNWGFNAAVLTVDSVQSSRFEPGLPEVSP